jgi:hypothetical protein
MVILARAISIALLLVLAVRPALAAELSQKGGEGGAIDDW